ncbi:unnamed protein product [Didymodactylos carnosus]|uniref:Serine protease n=1 Tax=Didymodactylos carnosus TaxID=1234261 RepID=A0A8S2CLY5_9BILA|nr:unnamed protein product [Didymodactylos carnosus]CAF3522306.1 unnamed protein product [Didymodactylos carnosus]
MIRSKHETSFERAFINARTNQIKRNIPFTVSYTGKIILVPESDMTIDLPIREQLQFLSKYIVKICVEYEHDFTTIRLGGSGLIIDGQYIISAAHVFNPLRDNERQIPYQKIKFASLTLASDHLFVSSNEHVFEAEMVFRGVSDNGLQPENVCSVDEDFAILRICDYDDVKNKLFLTNQSNYCPPRVLNKEELKLNSQLFLLSYCGVVRKIEDVEYYEYCSQYPAYTRENLNCAMYPDHKSVSVGKCLESGNDFFSHDCPSLRGSTGGAIFDINGRFVGLHTGVKPDDIHYNIQGKKRLQPDALNQAFAAYSSRLKQCIESKMTWK